MCFDLLYNFFSEIFLILRKFREMWSEMYLGLHVITFYAFSIVMKLEFSRQIFEEYLNIKFYAYPSSGSRVVPCGRKDGHTDIHEANSRFSQFCERA
jgi:hypothetical protein